jgi:A/G-specific adenine glycosylase
MRFWHLHTVALANPFLPTPYLTLSSTRKTSSSGHEFDLRLKPQAAAVAGLLSWFAQVRRDLPWRRKVDPYATWVSEIMLQQTRVEAVVPYFEAWMSAFPNVRQLAAADPELVLRHWAGLGYYRRARLLHQAARQVVDELDGHLPLDAASWRRLPGVGEYTSAAIASIAQGEAIAVVDGNVKRVAARFLGLDLAADDRQLHKLAWQWASRWMQWFDRSPSSGSSAGTERPAAVEGARPGDLNEALMELGATLCTARNPKCELCPVAGWCASKGPDAQLRPLPAAQVKWRNLRLVFGLAKNNGGVVLLQRLQGWNPGLWEPPSITLPGSTEFRAEQVEVRQGFPNSPSTAPNKLWKAKLSGRIGAPLGHVRHTITHHKITAEVFVLEDWQGEQAIDPASVALTGLAKKILRAFA